MSEKYLSPSFRLHSESEYGFLGEMDSAKALSLFWLDITRPLLVAAGARNILEIGAHKGVHTRWLGEYCSETGGVLTVIEPATSPELEKVIAGIPCAKILRGMSHALLSDIMVAVDAVILEGDLNYHTVLGDLERIESMAVRTRVPFPIVYFSSASWPYARRDMYYDPDNLPASGRKSYERSGMSPWLKGLSAGLINHPFANATDEGGSRNGVLTAVEEFVGQRSGKLKCFAIPVNHGLGIVYPAGGKAELFIASQLQPPPALARFLETIEITRLNTVVKKLSDMKNACRDVSRGTVLSTILAKIGIGGGDSK